jgi:hypothetical protein
VTQSVNARSYLTDVSSSYLDEQSLLESTMNCIISASVVTRSVTRHVKIVIIIIKNTSIINRQRIIAEYAL